MCVLGGGRHLRFPACRAGARTRAAHLLAGPAPRPPCAGSTGLRNARPGRTREHGRAWLQVGRAWLQVGRAGSRLTMVELLRSLQDSQLVARFQRRCGLFPAPEDNPRENSPGPSEGTTRVPEVAHLPANPQVTTDSCLQWGEGRRPPACLRVPATPRWGSRAPTAASQHPP